jgi:1-acyl-sn-glycerol-3-phosphate acyltransferase
MLLSPLHPGFCVKAELKKTIFGIVIDSLEGIYINRGGTEEERNKIVETIMARQIEIEDSGKNYNPICIFPEGTTTNGDYLL